jgi:hypothetical protein
VGIKKYIGFSLLLILIVGLYVYSVASGEYTMKVLDFSLTLPIVIWVLAPLLVLFIFTILHLLFYSSLTYFKDRNTVKDEETIIESIKTLLLDKEDKRKFKTSGFKDIVSILRQFKFEVKDETFTSKDEELNSMVSQIKDIKSGKYVNEKSLKLDTSSELAKKNLINKISGQVDYAVEVLKKSEQFDQEVVKAAFFNVLENKSMTTIKKLYQNVKLDKQMALKLFQKDVDNNEFGFTTDEILKIAKSLDYCEKDFIELAKLYKSILTPDKLIELFETISNDIDKATGAYFYILLELEMIEKLKELLSGYANDEYLVFRALLDLKDAGKHYNLDDITYN